MPRLYQVHGKPRDKEIRQCRNTELPDVNSDQHPLAKQLSDAGPAQRRAARLCAGHTIDIHQSAASLNKLNLRLRDQRMVFYVVDSFRPDEGEQEAEQAHKPKATPPAIGVGEPPKERSENYESKILRRVEDC